MAVAQESKDNWTVGGRRDTLTAKALRTIAAEQRVAELKAELSAAREELAHRDNKILSLEKSLDLNGDHSARLAGQLAEKSAAVESAQQQLEQMRLAFNALNAERYKANKKSQEEASALTARLETALARAEKAEKVLADAQHKLLSLGLDNSAALRRINNLKGSLRERASKIEELAASQAKLADERGAALKRVKEREAKLADEIKARTAALKRADELESRLADEIKARDAALKRAEGQALLRSKLANERAAALKRAEEQESKLADEIKARDAALKCAEEQALLRSKLADECDAALERAEVQAASQTRLAEEIKIRDAALRRAEERIRLLAELFVQLEAKANYGGAQENSEIDAALPYGQLERIAHAGAGNGQAGNRAVLERDLDNDAWLFGGRKSARLS